MKALLARFVAAALAFGPGSSSAQIQTAGGTPVAPSQGPTEPLPTTAPPPGFVPPPAPASAAPPPAWVAPTAPVTTQPATAAAPGVPAAPTTPYAPVYAPGYAPPPGFAPPAYATPFSSPPTYPPAPAYALPPGYAPPAYAPGVGSLPPPGYYPPPPYYPVAQADSGQPAGPPPGHHEHDGFFLRIGGGGSYLRASNGTLGTTVSGYGVFVAVAAGGVVAKNLVLYGEIQASLLPSPNIQRSQAGSSVQSDYDLTQLAIGPGLGYFIEPWGAYASWTLTYAQLTQSKSSTSSTSSSSDSTDVTEVGIGSSFKLGKEWWISSNWGLGAALQFQVASMKDNNFDNRWTSTELALLCSTTFN